MEKISVIVPVYNVEQYLNQCVESLLAQTYGDFEIVLVDDGSPDACPAMCDTYGANYDNVHVIHQQNGGLSAARNTGIEWVLKNSDSNWISFVDSDDWVHPRYLELLWKAANKYEARLSTCRFVYTQARDEQVNQIGEDSVELKKTIEIYTDDSFDPNSACARLFQTELWREVRFPVGRLHEDRFTTYKLLFLQNDIPVVTEAMYYYYMNSEGICRSQWTPRKIDNIVAAEEQIAYFAKNGLIDAWKHTEKVYIRLVIQAMKDVHAADPQDRTTYKMLQKKLRQTLRSNGHKLGYRFTKDFNIYKYAWPIPVKAWRRLMMIISSKPKEKETVHE